MIRNIKKILLVVILMAAMLFSGCENAMELVEEESVRADAEALMNAIEAKDSEYIYDTYFSYMNKLEFNSGMTQIYEAYKGERISTKLYNMQSKTFYQMEGDKKSESTKAVVYIIETTESIYTLNLSYYREGDEEYALVGANLSLFTNYVVNENFKDYGVKTWVLFSLNIISYGIMILALLLCIKTKIKKKPLWIILILLQVGVTITNFPNQSSINYSFIQLLGVNGYYLFAHGGTITKVFVHIFAIVFLIVRKNLNKSYLYGQEMKRIKEENEQILIEEFESKDAEKVTEGETAQISLPTENINSNECKTKR